MKIPILTLIPSAYKTSKVYSILPVNGDGDFDFSRLSPGTRVQENGLIETKTNNVPRLDWLNSDCPSLLLEPQRTNYAIYSNDASQWNNVSGSQSITKTQNYSIAPDGEQTATRLQATATGSGYSLIALTTTGFTGNYSGSVYLKSNTGSTENVIVYGRNTSVNSYAIGNEWQRIEIQGSGTSGQNLYLFLGSFPNNGSDESVDILVWGGQLEQGIYPTSYIKTESSTVTRLKDFISGGGNANLFNSLEGTFFVQMSSFLNAQTNSNGIELSDSSGQNRVTIQYDTQNNQIRGDIRVSNVAQAIFTTGFYDVKNFNKIAVTYKYNEAKLYVNGSLIATDTSVNIFAEDTLTEVRSTIAGISADAFNLQAKIKDLRVYDRVLTEAEAIELTTL